MKIAMTALMLAAGALADAAPAPAATTPAQTAAPTTTYAGARKAGKATNKQRPRLAAALPAGPGARFIAPMNQTAAPETSAAHVAAMAGAVPATAFPAAKTARHKFGKTVNKQKVRAAAVTVPATAPSPR